MSQSPTTQAEQWTLISTYTRAQAIADGALVPATAATATEAGWKHPVAYTAAAHAQAVAWSDEVEAGKEYHSGQDQSGREWDVLSMAARAPGTRSAQRLPGLRRARHRRRGDRPRDGPGGPHRPR